MSWQADIDDIKKSFREGRLIPFVGAGLSMCVPNFPSWSDLLARLRGALPTSDDKQHFDDLDRDPLERAEFFCRVKGNQGQEDLRKEVKSILEDAEKVQLPADPAGKEKALNCQMILARSFNRIYTTNYDRLLEIACTLAGHTVFPIFSANSAQNSPREEWCKQDFVSDSPAKPSQIVQVIKYHGDYTDQEDPRVPLRSVVVTEGDYYRRLIDLDTKDVLLMRDLIFYDVLFLGYSFRDMSLKYVFHQITRLLEEANRDFPTIRKGRLFFVTTETNDARASYLQVAYGVKTLCIEDRAGKIPDPSGTVEFDHTLISPQGMPHKLQLNKFNYLYRLADNEPLPGWNRIDKLYEAVEYIFGLKGSLDHQGRLLVETLANSKAFTSLRANVMHACYCSVLEEIVK